MVYLENLKIYWLFENYFFFITKNTTNPAITINNTITTPTNVVVSMIIVQYRNRRTGIRKTFQISEILPNSETNVLIQLDIKSGKLNKINKSKSLFNTIELFTGFSKNELTKSLNEKEAILKWMVKQNVNTVDSVGKVMAEYYTQQDYLMKFVKKNRPLV